MARLVNVRLFNAFACQDPRIGPGGWQGIGARPKHLTKASVQVWRLRHHLPPFRFKRRQWKPAEIAMLGKVSDKEVSRQTGWRRNVIAAKRKKLGIVYQAALVRPWRRAEDKLLGTGSDRDVAKMLSRSIHSVSMRRRKLRIKQANPNYRYWTNREDRFLRIGTIDQAARRLRRTAAAIKHRRVRLGLPRR
jgi:hypothetical protein